MKGSWKRRGGVYGLSAGARNSGTKALVVCEVTTQHAAIPLSPFSQQAPYPTNRNHQAVGIGMTVKGESRGIGEGTYISPLNFSPRFRRTRHFPRFCLRG